MSRSSSPTADTHPHDAAEPAAVPNPPLLISPIFSILSMAMTGPPMPVANHPAPRSGGDDDGNDEESDEFFEGDGGDYWW